MTSRPGGWLAATTITVLLLSSCTRPEDAVSTTEALPPPTETTTSIAVSETTTPVTAATTTMPPEAAPTSTSTSAPTSAPSTTEASTTVAPAPTTTRPLTEPSDLTLVFDALGPFRFGARDVDVVPALVELLGDPVVDVATEYPVADEGSFLDETGEQSYVAPFGRTVCFANTLCTQFGAGAPETLIFTGWRLDDSAPSDLATVDGIRVGDTWAEHLDTIAIDPANSCYWIGYADTGGIEIILLSDDTVFAAYEDDDIIFGDPDPADVTVIQMQAGRFPTFIFDDC